MPCRCGQLAEGACGRSVLLHCLNPELAAPDGKDTTTYRLATSQARFNFLKDWCMSVTEADEAQEAADDVWWDNLKAYYPDDMSLFNIKIYINEWGNSLQQEHLKFLCERRLNFNVALFTVNVNAQGKNDVTLNTTVCDIRVERPWIIPYLRTVEGNGHFELLGVRNPSSPVVTWTFPHTSTLVQHLLCSVRALARKDER